MLCSNFNFHLPFDTETDPYDREFGGFTQSPGNVRYIILKEAMTIASIQCHIVCAFEIMPMSRSRKKKCLRFILIF
jgi:hypothetical protein